MHVTPAHTDLMMSRIICVCRLQKLEQKRSMHYPGIQCSITGINVTSLAK